MTRNIRRLMTILGWKSPTTVVIATAENPTYLATIPVTITFSKTVTGFEEGDITISGGTLSNFAGSGASYTVDVTPSAVAVTLDIAANVCAEGNAAATQLAISALSQLAGIVFRVESSSGLYQDAAKTTPATANNDPVGAWADLSGNGHDFLQSTEANRPLLKTDVVGTMDGIVFDLTNDLLSTASFDSTIGTGGYTLLALLTGRTGTTADAYFSVGTTTYFLSRNNSTPYTLKVYEGGNKIFTNVLASGTQYVVTWRRTGTSLLAYVDGVIDATQDKTSSASWGDLVMNIGEKFDAPLYCIILYKGALSDANRALVESYLKKK